jgi:hypothetical protein
LSRNNQSRLSAQQPAFSVEPVSAMPQTHITVSVPTEFVQLPSKGIYYPPDHPLHNKDTIEIKYMTAKEEDILTSEALIKKGLVLERLIDSIIVDKSIDPGSLLVSDRSAILIAARASAYGNDYEAAVSCPHCSVKNEISCDLSLFEPTYHEVVEDIRVTSNGTCVVRLPKSGKSVEFRMYNGYDERNAMNTNDKVVISNQVTDQLKRIVLSIDGSQDIGVIHAFIMNMPAFDSRYLRKVIKQATPTTELRHKLSCSACKQESVVEVPIGVKFFWPDF